MDLDHAGRAGDIDLGQVVADHVDADQQQAARGGEAVILVENIRSYYDILVRNEPPLPITLAKSPENTGKAKGKPGIKLKP